MRLGMFQKSLTRFAALFVVVCAVLSSPAVFANSASNVALPDFTLEANDGSAWRLFEQDGPKVFMFWATWCPHCKKLFPTIQSIHERYESAGLTVVAISVFDDGDTRAYAAQRGLTMVVLKHGDALAEGLNVPGTPTVIVLNHDNKVVFGAVNPDPNDTSIELVVRRLLEIAPNDRL